MTRQQTGAPSSATELETYSDQVRSLALPHIQVFSEIAETDPRLTMSVLLTVVGNSIAEIYPESDREAPVRALRDLAGKLESGEIDALLSGKGGRA